MIAFRNYRLLASIFFLPSAFALQCGQPLTTPCLGATDIRYNAEASNDAIDQAEVWKKFGGYFVGTGKVQIRFDDADDLSSAYDLTIFVNNTIIGSRLYSHRIEINDLGDIFVNDTFATTTYEKNGKLSFTSPSTVVPKGQDIFDAYPVDENSAFSTYHNANGDVGSESWYALDSNANKARIISDQFKEVNGSLVLSKTYSAFETRVTEEEWIKQSNAKLTETYDIIYNFTIPPDAELISLPMETACFEDPCPLEAENWCSQDPECSESPYQEPSAAMLPGPIAGFVVLGVAILLTGFYFLHRYLHKRQAKRYKTVFAKRIAETIQVNKSIRSMGPEELAEEFKRVDLQTHDGLITKDDLWEFISSGKAGEISKGDFNALFAAIDADGDGQVDFLAFCAFMGQCHDEYRAARADRASLANVSARRLQVADTTARASFRHLSMSMNEDMESDMREAAISRNMDDDEKMLEAQSVEVS